MESDSSYQKKKGRGKEIPKDIELPMEEILNAIPKKALAKLKMKYSGPETRGIKPDRPRTDKQLANDQRLREIAQKKRDDRFTKLEENERQINVRNVRNLGFLPTSSSDYDEIVEGEVKEEKKENMLKIPKSYLSKTSGTNSHVAKKYKELERKLEDTKKIVSKQVEEIPRVIQKVKEVIEKITPPHSPKYPSTATPNMPTAQSKVYYNNKRGLFR